MAGIFSTGAEVPCLIFVDFDHTLLGGNSTELFIANSRPFAVVSVLNFLVRKCIPWRLVRTRNWFRLRDYAFCRLLFTLLPHNLERWREMGPAIFEQLRNFELEEVLEPMPQRRISIVTFGMEAIVKPMLRGSRWEQVDILATPRVTSLSYFSNGKLEMARHAYGDEALAKSMLITDSEDDLDLLQAVGRPVLIVPHGAPRHGRH